MSVSALPITIHCFNSSTVLKNSDMFLMINAINTQLPAFCSHWGAGKQYVCQASPVPTGPKRSMYCVFLDESDSAGALAYHTEVGNVPLSKVFVKTVLKYKGAILMGASANVPTVAQAFAHEIYEMIANFNVNVWWQLSNGVLVPGEVCDAVEGNIVPINFGTSTVALSDYILPAWSDPQATVGPYNYLNTLTKPFQIAKRGYSIVMKNNATSQIMGASVTPYVQYKADIIQDLFKHPETASSAFIGDPSIKSVALMAMAPQQSVASVAGDVAEVAGAMSIVAGRNTKAGETAAVISQIAGTVSTVGDAPSVSDVVGVVSGVAGIVSSHTDPNTAIGKTATIASNMSDIATILASDKDTITKVNDIAEEVSEIADIVGESLDSNSEVSIIASVISSISKEIEAFTQSGADASTPSQ
jgi:hypothetical protein